MSCANDNIVTKFESACGLTCAERNEQKKTMVEARTAGCKQNGEGRDETMKWVYPWYCGQQTCFRDDPPQSQMAQLWRKWHFGQKVDPNYQATVDPASVDTDMDWFFELVRNACFQAGLGGISQWYSIYNEMDASSPQPNQLAGRATPYSQLMKLPESQHYAKLNAQSPTGWYNTRTTPPKYADVTSMIGQDGKYGAVPPILKDGNDGTDQTKPIWQSDGKYGKLVQGSMPKANLLLEKEGNKYVPKGVYLVPGLDVRTGSHTICMAFEIPCPMKKGEEYTAKCQFYPGKWEVLKNQFLINYGPKQFGWKSFVWFFGSKDKGDAPNDSPSMKTRIGGSGQSHLAMVFENVDTRIYKTRHFKKQIMCSVYDAYNQWLQLYINGVLFGERPMNQYDEFSQRGTPDGYGISNQFGDSIDVVHNDLWIGATPEAGKGNDFQGRISFVGVWNHYLMNQRDACLMAGIQADKCPEIKISCIPTVLPDAVNKPKTMYEIKGVRYSKPNNYVNHGWTYDQATDFQECSWDGKSSTMPGDWATSERNPIGTASKVGGEADGVSGGAIAGIVIGILVFLLLVGAGFYWWKFWRPAHSKNTKKANGWKFWGSGKGAKGKKKKVKKKKKGKKKIFVAKK